MSSEHLTPDAPDSARRPHFELIINKEPFTETPSGAPLLYVVGSREETRLTVVSPDAYVTPQNEEEANLAYHGIFGAIQRLCDKHFPRIDR